MDRITISMDDTLAHQFHEFIRNHGYSNRSEAIRDLIRRQIGNESLVQDHSAHCVGTLTYVYNHNERDLAARLNRQQHSHHDLVLSTIHTHLDHDHCLETMLLRGPTARIRQFADSVMAESGVHHGGLHLVPVALETRTGHHHGESAQVQHLHTPPAI
jgi:CopG family nickel-responsive transcriptional regulator